MKIDRVTASIRCSKEVHPGVWKAVELSAEGTVEPGDIWQNAQARLYADLTRQLHVLWAGNGHQAHGDDAGQDEPSSPPAQPRWHWCEEHQTGFAQHIKGEQAWYSHKAPDGAWCREAA